ncbi:MAG: hypothetical protein RR212_06475 [Bacteroidales bacterium]
MRKLIFISLIVLSACGSSAVMTTGSSTPMNQTPAQNQQSPNFTPPVPASTFQGIGPVNIAESNFYFAGDFQILDGMPLFYDCMAGANIPIATGKGVYKQLADQYKTKITNAGEILRAKIHGYFIDQPTTDYPKQLVVTYVNDLAKGTVCTRQKELPGTWNADLVGATKGTVALTLTNTFDFTAKITTATGTTTIKGSWMMTSPEEIGLFYTDMTTFLGHSASFNPNNMTMFVPTQTGTLILKKE